MFKRFGRLFLVLGLLIFPLIAEAAPRQAVLSELCGQGAVASIKHVVEFDYHSLTFYATCGQGQPSQQGFDVAWGNVQRIEVTVNASVPGARNTCTHTSLVGRIKGECLVDVDDPQGAIVLLNITIPNVQ